MMKIIFKFFFSFRLFELEDNFIYFTQFILRNIDVRGINNANNLNNLNNVINNFLSDYLNLKIILFI